MTCCCPSPSLPRTLNESSKIGKSSSHIHSHTQFDTFYGTHLRELRHDAEPRGKILSEDLFIRNDWLFCGASHSIVLRRTPRSTPSPSNGWKTFETWPLINPRGEDKKYTKDKQRLSLQMWWGKGRESSRSRARDRKREKGKIEMIQKQKKNLAATPISIRGRLSRDHKILLIIIFSLFSMLACDFGHSRWGAAGGGGCTVLKLVFLLLF